MAGFLNKLLSFGEGKEVKKYESIVSDINALEPEIKTLSDDELRAKTEEFRARFDAGESLDDLMVEAFAVVREASVRALGMRHFDVQLIGGMTLHDGQISEMKTGEGKTLVSTLAGYLNALSSGGVHIVTVNDYLAKRDSEWMGQIYCFLGLKVGLIQNGMKTSDKRPAYDADITYGTNSEFGFDYLRDNMVTRAKDRVQRGHAFAIVDEVDSILIDEARTPLIISGAGRKAADIYKKFAKAVRILNQGADFEKDEAKKTIMATESGLVKVEREVGIEDLYADPSGQMSNHLQQALKAEFLFKRDVDYVVVDGELKIVDEFTGRIMEGRRYSEGLHQALEAKENVAIKEENQTLATITLQNYFRLYKKLAGMTGTAMTEDSEFKQIYKLSVIAIPSNVPVVRDDRNDLIYRTLEAKYKAIADDIEEKHHRGQPCLVGTVAIETSELLARLLDKRGIKHEILNAKHHEREANIVAQAGRVGAVTIATNMAGRGTDILLGGNPNFMIEEFLIKAGIDPKEATEDEELTALERAKEQCAKDRELVVAAGGLAVIGTERHEARRIDNQLRGRAGRQGDPGVTQFYLSLEDDLMRLFGKDKMAGISRIMERANMPEDLPIEAGMVSKAIESAQHQVEAMHFEARKNVLEYDDIMNRQRQAIYEGRNDILDGKNVSERAEDMIERLVERTVEEYCPSKRAADDWDIEGLGAWFEQTTGIQDFDIAKVETAKSSEQVMELIFDFITERFNEKEELLGEEQAGQLEMQVMLRVMDVKWMNHLQDMDYLRGGIGLRAFGQRDPLVEYKNEAHLAFEELRDSMYEDFVTTFLRIQVVVEEEETQELNNVSYSGPSEDTPSIVGEMRSSMTATGGGELESSQTISGPPKANPTGKQKTYVKDKNDPFANAKPNDPCPCGSGKKFKKCHGKPVGMV